MSEDQKNQLFSHIPFFLFIIFGIVFAFIPKNYFKFWAILDCSFIIMQGIVFIFKKKVRTRFSYMTRIEKIVYGILCIIGGIIAIIYLCSILH